MNARGLPRHMNTEAEDRVPVEVEVPDALLAELDAYAAKHGYRSLDAVVSEALARSE
jgi:metal-responsive CopG/Arc/MetJ family transcriptional regulator